MTLLHPFEDTDVVHGQGTCGMELLEQAKELLGENSDGIGTIVVPFVKLGMTDFVICLYWFLTKWNGIRKI